MNFDRYPIENLGRSHNSHHSKKSCREFTNTYNFFLAPLVVTKKEKVDEEVEE